MSCNELLVAADYGGHQLRFDEGLAREAANLLTLE